MREITKPNKGEVFVKVGLWDDIMKELKHFRDTLEKQMLNGETTASITLTDEEVFWIRQLLSRGGENC